MIKELREEVEETSTEVDQLAYKLLELRAGIVSSRHGGFGGMGGMGGMGGGMRAHGRSDRSVVRLDGVAGWHGDEVKTLSAILFCYSRFPRPTSRIGNRYSLMGWLTLRRPIDNSTSCTATRDHRLVGSEVVERLLLFQFRSMSLRSGLSRLPTPSAGADPSHLSYQQMSGSRDSRRASARYYLL